MKTYSNAVVALHTAGGFHTRCQMAALLIMIISCEMASAACVLLLASDWWQ